MNRLRAPRPRWRTLRHPLAAATLAGVFATWAGGCGGSQKAAKPGLSPESKASEASPPRGAHPPAGHSEHAEQAKQYGGAADKHHGCPHAQTKGDHHAHGDHGHGHHGHGHHGHGHHGQGHDAKRHGMHHRFVDAAKWSKVFESKKRDAWQKGDAVIASLKLAKDAKVADVGAGTGYFAVRFARQLRMGVVYAIDIEPTMVAWVKKRAQRERLENVVGVVATARSPRIPGPVDVIFVSDTYHHIGERPSYFARLHRQLRPGGRVVIVDFKMGDLPVGPPNRHKIEPERIIQEMAKAGYKLTRRDDKLLPYQHLFEFSPAQ